MLFELNVNCLGNKKTRNAGRPYQTRCFHPYVHLPFSYLPASSKHILQISAGMIVLVINLVYKWNLNNSYYDLNICLHFKSKLIQISILTIFGFISYCDFFSPLENRRPLIPSKSTCLCILF